MPGEIVAATDDDIARFYDGARITVPWRAKAIRLGRIVGGVGGVVQDGDGTWFAFLDVPRHLRTPVLYRHVKQGLLELAGAGATVVRATCNSDIPRADAFLRRLGFEPTQDYRGDERVWEWRCKNCR